MRPVLATSLLLLLVLSSSFIQSAIADTAAGPPIPAPNSCESMCGVRCAKAGYQKRCIRYCMMCCNDCKCVPSGTYGNKSECPCYRDKKNSKGTSKCP
ncbi:hypothetical protein K2173_014873 [Erythroxylum novogranatense]|uniref:Uncharacterized protein n=1 Tax=Erythroxylum novogranatense TaxID=1862640 RepID=A0AAV8TH72_9ROSI|nr:hypothetical protein K2173_014873 [Erythroxylum novogranatense]